MGAAIKNPGTRTKWARGINTENPARPMQMATTFQAFFEPSIFSIKIRESDFPLSRPSQMAFSS